jgi:hypothetical protein
MHPAKPINFRRRALTASLTALILLALFPPTHRQSIAQADGPASASPVFAEVADQVGLDFQHYAGVTGHYYLPEIMGAGAALFDFDNDGDLDVFLVQGAELDPGKPALPSFRWRGSAPPRARLYRNDLEKGSGGKQVLKFTDVTDKSGIVATGYGMGVAAGDINNDGLTDLYICDLGSNQMLLNSGHGTFTDVTVKSGSDDNRWSTSAAFFDYDKDGWLDLFIVNYVDFSVRNNPVCYASTGERDYCTPRAFRPVGNLLLHNKGNGTFEDVSMNSGISRDFGRGLGVVTGDFNGDGWLDIYVANDGDPNQLWINQKNGTFKNEAFLAGAALNRNGQAEAGMGVDAGDFDGDGDEDIFITHLMEETNTLFVNTSDAVFEDRTFETGLASPARRYTGFGTLWFDYDNDGWLDLLVTNGAVRTLQDLARKGDPYPFSQPNQLFRNAGGTKFVDRSEEAGEAFSRPAVGRGAAFGDIDNDGDTDVLVSNNNGRARLFLNEVGNRNHWLGVRLVSKAGGRDALGARLEFVVNSKTSLWRRVRTDGGYLSSQDPRVLVGLAGERRVEALRVYWPSGRIDQWKSLPVDQYLTFSEGASRQTK